MSQAGIINLIENNPSLAVFFEGNSGTAIPFFNVIRFIGAGGITTSAAGNTVTITGPGAGPFVLSVSGTINRITSTGGVNPVIDIASTYVGQSSITTLGTITTGIWNATAIGPTFGGTGQTTYATGDTLYASAANTLSKLTAGSNGQVLTLAAGIPSWVSPVAGTVTSVSGTLNRITSTGGATPVIDISASYVGQTSITTLGTITTGVWDGTAIDATHGGTAQTTWATGDLLYASGVNTLAKLTAGSNTQVLTLAGGVPTWAAPATAGTVTSVSGTTNRITSTGGTTPVIDISASYVGQSSITTLGTITTGVWNGTVIDLAHGGTNAALTASNGGIFYSTATAGAILAGTATAGQIIRSGATAAPTWSTTTYPATNAINTLLYASAANVMSALATANGGVLTTNSTGVPSIDTTNFSVLTTGVQMKGNNTNTAPPAGFIGEQIRSFVNSSSPVTMSHLTITNITSINLTSGVWDVSGLVILNATNTNTTNPASVVSIVSTTSTTGNEGDNATRGSMPSSSGTVATAPEIGLSIPSFRILVSSTTTYFLTAYTQATITFGCTAWGRISATRVG